MKPDETAPLARWLVSLFVLGLFTVITAPLSRTDPTPAIFAAAFLIMFGLGRRSK